MTTYDLFHTPTSPGDRGRHDSSQCPHGAAIIIGDDGTSGVAYPRRCNWCTEHDRPWAP